MPETSSLSEADILADVIVPHQGNMPPEAARLILDWKFSDDASERMRTLLEKNNRGLLADMELAELDKYRRVGMLVDLLHAKAHASLKAGASPS